MELEPTLHVTSRAEWRAWLEANSRTQREVWLIYFKSHTGAPALAYEDSVEEALCFGWIDSLIRRIDDQRYARLFTPRRSGSPWSESNRRRFAKMVQEGRMTDLGRALYPFPITDEDPGPPPRRSTPDLSADLLAVLQANPLAWENFQKLPPSARRLYCGWVMSAKREETRLKRMQEAIGLLEQGKRLSGK